jgi:hypothetical protein
MLLTVKYIFSLAYFLKLSVLLENPGWGIFWKHLPDHCIPGGRPDKIGGNSARPETEPLICGTL